MDEESQLLEQLNRPVETDISIAKPASLFGSGDLAQRMLRVGNTGLEIQMAHLPGNDYMWAMHFYPDKDKPGSKFAIQDTDRDRAHRRAGLFARGFLAFYRWWQSNPSIEGFPRASSLWGATNQRFLDFQIRVFGHEVLEVKEEGEKAEKLIHLDRIADHPEVITSLEEIAGEYGQ